MQRKVARPALSDVLSRQALCKKIRRATKCGNELNEHRNQILPTNSSLGSNWWVASPLWEAIVEHGWQKGKNHREQIVSSSIGRGKNVFAVLHIVFTSFHSSKIPHPELANVCYPRDMAHLAFPTATWLHSRPFILHLVSYKNFLNKSPTSTRSQIVPSVLIDTGDMVAN